MITAADQEFWEKIRKYQIGTAQAALSFTDRLARENRWTLEFTHRAVLEYKRFIYLICITHLPMTPSEVVDEVWHLHLLYTRDYWKVFCGEILNREIHHGPTEGGSQERQKYETLYLQTYQQYLAHFGSLPPEDIWPVPEARFVATPKVKIDLKRHLVLPIPNWLRWKS